MARSHQTLEIKRRKPRQARAAGTVETILEGAAQVLEAGGLASFTTNAVAARAGVSIGTLYQYFADKQALLQALAEREVHAVLSRVARALSGAEDPTLEGRVRAMVRAMASAFGGRMRARKAVMLALLAQHGGGELIAPIAAFLAEARAHQSEYKGEHQDPESERIFPLLSREQQFVLSRSLMGAVRAAVLEEQPFLKSRVFEDELVRLTLGYLASLPRLSG